MAGLDEGELSHIRSQLESDHARLRAQITATEQELADSLWHSDERDRGDGVDAGDWALSIQQESSLASNAQELLRQTALALSRIESGDYGICDRCGHPIPVERLRVFPRATTCLPCRAQEGRHR
jgi:RNA polymerase-binding protein DksA